MSRRADQFRKARAIVRSEGLRGLGRRSAAKLAARGGGGVRIDRFPEHERFPWFGMVDVDEQDLAENAATVAAWNDAAGPREVRTATWLLPHFSHAYFGGIYTIFRFIDGFQRRGIENRVVIFDDGLADPEVVRGRIAEAWPSLRDIDVTCGTGPGRDPLEHLPESDIGVATLWMSAFALARWRGVRGKHYFVQDYEPEFYPAGSAFALAEQSYRFGFTGIVNTPGLAEAYGEWGNPTIPFTPSVDRNVYHPDPARSDEPVRIVFYNRPSIDRNAFGLGLAALAKVKARFGDRVDIVGVGEAFDPAAYGLDGVLRSAGLLPGLEAVAELYRSAHIGLVLMFTRHPSYQPFEYMASGCATVTNQNRWTDWLFRDGYNALLSAPTASCLADRIAELVENPQLRDQIADGGARTLDDHSWEDEIERVYQSICTGSGVTPPAAPALR